AKSYSRMLCIHEIDTSDFKPSVVKMLQHLPTYKEPPNAKRSLQQPHPLPCILNQKTIEYLVDLLMPPNEVASLLGIHACREATPRLLHKLLQLHHLLIPSLLFVYKWKLHVWFEQAKRCCTSTDQEGDSSSTSDPKAHFFKSDSCSSRLLWLFFTSAAI
ncbi:hypothetical protein Dimus_013439, partial [Dionaea muscipula]